MILIAIGANLPGPDGRSPLANCQAAAAVLGGTRGLRLVALSRWWLSAPIPASNQPDYVNGVARLAGEIEPAALLEALQAMERAAGRRPGGRPGGRNAARPLDLDIIAMGALRRPAPDPVLPHPRAHLRAFVLAPLAEVAPGWVHPEIGRTVEALLAELPTQRLCPLEIAGDLACRG
ncbi:MAG: 2-amino-4-hydroxy-6-hydroxymethyldihydropteridine diphosphokinase [Acetobacteraceae bacterium]